MAVALADVVAVSSAVGATRSRLAKVAAMAELLRPLRGEDAVLVASFLAGEPRQPRLDVGWAALRDVRPEPAAATSLTVTEVDAALAAIAAAAGAGSVKVRRRVLADLLGRATADEQAFLRGLIHGELRQGALAGIVVKGVASGAAVDEDLALRALMLSGDLGEVAAAALGGGAEALRGFTLTLFRPVLPMLASTATDPEEALAGLGPAAVDWKLDGARMQVHREGDRVAVYTRNLRDVTARNPEVVAAALALPGTSAVLDGEVLLVGPDQRPRTFQETMSRFGADAPREAVLAPFFFDVLHVDGTDLLSATLEERTAVLDALVPEALRVPRALATTPAEVAAVLDAALEVGHEGVVVKALASPYDAGRRGAAWRKIKPVHTLDLVVLAVEWGSGRRQGWLSNLHLGARGPDGGFVMLGKTFKGLTDQLLTWQTQRFLALETHRSDHVVHVRPEQVVEIAFDGVQVSTRYPGGVALRFARVRRYRDDKDPEEADTLATVRSYLP